MRWDMARRFGYMRVSTERQDEELQRHELRQAGVRDEDLFVEVYTGYSGRDERPQLDRILTEAVQGDSVVVWALDRLGRSVLHLHEIAESLRTRGVTIVAIKQGIDTGTMAGRMAYGIIGSLAEFEREMLRERVKAGMAAAKRAGRHVGRPRKLTRARLDEARRMLSEGRSFRQVAHIFDVAPSTLHEALRRS
jgi:DNA invertase Pin-like site-specific DNA recombinase